MRAGSRVRVLHVIQNLNYGGMERLLADIVCRVDPERVESHVLCFQYLGRFARGLESRATLHTAAALPRYSLLWPGALAAQVRRIAPDVVHTHSGVWYKASLAARLAGVRHLIHTEHGRKHPDPLPARLFDGLAARRTDVVVAVSDSVARLLSERWIASERQIRVIPNGVDTELYRPRGANLSVRAELGIAPDRPVIGSIGRVEHIKGTDILVEAFIRLCAEWSHGPRPALVVGGEGSLRTALLERGRAAGVEDSIRLLGWRDDIHDLQSAFTLFTLSSRSEGTSVGLLEAMSAGLCPVVTDVGGNAAVLGPELSHRLVPAEDPESLAAAWKAALLDPERRSRDGRTARARVQEHFGIDVMVRRYQVLYEEKAGRRERPPFALGSAPRDAGSAESDRGRTIE